MERPKAQPRPQRQVTGEIEYFDWMRMTDSPVLRPYLDQSDMLIQDLEAAAGSSIDLGIRPAIMEDYDAYDKETSEMQWELKAFADEFLALRDAHSAFTFIDIHVEVSAEDVLARLQEIAAGKLLAKPDTQLAIESDGSYYPKLDITKQDSQLTGVGVRVWGWDDRKWVKMKGRKSKNTYPNDLLWFPEDEKAWTRKFDISFGYRHPKAGPFSETVSMTVSEGADRISMETNVWVSEYAETGYEGHGGTYRRKCKEADVLAFADLIAHIVGDEPISRAEYKAHQLQVIREKLAPHGYAGMLDELIDASWDVQALYEITKPRFELRGASIADALQTYEADEAQKILRDCIHEYRTRREMADIALRKMDPELKKAWGL